MRKAAAPREAWLFTAPALIALRALCTDDDIRSKTLLAVVLTCVGFSQSLTAVALAPDLGERYLDTIYQTNWIRDLYGEEALESEELTVA